MSIMSIQVNQIQMYRLSSFPEQRINDLISELNVHYGKINGYIEAQISQDKIDVEIIDSLAKLEEIIRLAPYQIQSNQLSGDFRLGIDLLESVIALLNTRAGHESARKKLLDLGWNLLKKLYQFSYDRLVREALLFSWLKLNNLVRHQGFYRNGFHRSLRVGERIEFSPSKEEVDDFYNANRGEIYQYMIHEMGPNIMPIDPFSQFDAANFYHYYQTLSNISVSPRSAA